VVMMPTFETPPGDIGPVVYTPGPVMMIGGQDFAGILLVIPGILAPVGYKMRSRSETDEIINGLKIVRDRIWPSKASDTN